MERVGGNGNTGTAGPYRLSVSTGPPSEEILVFQREVYGRKYGAIPEDGLDQLADFLVARDSTNRLVSSVRVLRKPRASFSFDGAVDLSKIPDLGNQPAEVGRWCVREDLREISHAHGLHFGIMKLVYLYALRQGVSAYLICVYPELATFYRGLYFSDSGVRFEHHDWGEVRLFVLRLAEFREQLSAKRTKLARYLLEEPGPNFRLA